MRIKRKIQLAGLAVALAGGVTGAAEAADRTVADDITTPLATSNPDGSASPGNITVTDDGSITVGAGQSAITVDSSNNVTMDGALDTTDADNSTGIRIIGGNVGPNTILSSGTITLDETYTVTDTDSDGDLDGNLALGTNRHGIFLQAGPTFNGDILNSGSILIEGNNSSAITLNGLLNGDFENTGLLSVTGENSAGIAINGGVTGDVIAHGNMTVRGQGSVGLLVGGDIGGELSVSGSYVVTGYNSLTVPTNQATLEPNDIEQGGSAVQISANVAGGVTLEGIGVENDDDDDGDGEVDETDDNAGVVLSVAGSSPALLVQADGSNIVLGPGEDGYGLHVRGAISAAGLYDAVSATAVRIEGDGLGATTTITGGATFDNGTASTAIDADSIALVIGDGGILSQILQRGTMTASVSSDLNTTTARTIVLEAGASVPTITNTGIIAANHFGENGDAVAITDASGALTTITNSGTIIARVIATDDDLTDDIPAPPVTGSAIAIDASANSGGLLIEQIQPVVFTDDDATDDSVAVVPTITGAILLGSGADTIDLMYGDIFGDVSFGNGADVFNIDDGGYYQGQITDLDGNLTLNVGNGVLYLEGGALDITSATFGASSVLGVQLSNVPSETTFIEASGTVTFAPGAVISPVVPIGLPEFGSLVFLTANGGLFGASNVTGAVTGDIPFLYNISIEVTDTLAADGDPNSLQTVFDRKTPAELGLTANQAAGFEEIIAALQRDDEASAAMAGVTSEYEFFDAYEDLLPNYGPGATEIAATAIQQMQSATSNRMAATRMQGLDEVSVWGQEIAYGITREPPNANSQEFRGHGFGFAGGIDGPTDNGALFGLSGSFIASEVEEPGRPEGEISLWFAQANAYYATAMGPVDLDFIVGGGFGKMTSRRFVEIGNPVEFSALSEADWMSYEGHGAARASVPLSAGWFTVTPQAALTYVAINEDGYEESGGGAAIDYRVDSVFSQRLWGDVGVELSARWDLGGNSALAPRIFAGYRANLLDEEAERTVQFVSGGAPFTLTDEGVGEGGPIIGIGFDATNGYSTFSLGYEGEFGDQVERHSINAAIRFRF